MALLIRLLLVLLLLGDGWAGMRYLTTRDAKWLSVLRWAPKIFVALMLISFFWLVIERCLGG